MMATTTTAVCWALTSQDEANDITALRIVLFDCYVGQQRVSRSNQRVRWGFSKFASMEEATKAAISATQEFEKNYAGKVDPAPAEVLLYPQERKAIENGGAIPASLRARVFTSLQRREKE